MGVKEKNIPTFLPQYSFEKSLYDHYIIVIFKQPVLHGNLYFLFPDVLKRWSFRKNRVGIWSFLYYLERCFFSPWKHDIFSLGRKWETTFLKKFMETWCFLCTRTAVTNVAPRPSVKKDQRWSYLAKIHLKVIGILDWHPRKSSSNSLYFH